MNEINPLNYLQYDEKYLTFFFDELHIESYEKWLQLMRSTEYSETLVTPPFKKWLEQSSNVNEEFVKLFDHEKFVKLLQNQIYNTEQYLKTLKKHYEIVKEKVIDPNWTPVKILPPYKNFSNVFLFNDSINVLFTDGNNFFSGYARIYKNGTVKWKQNDVIINNVKHWQNIPIYKLRGNYE